MRFIEYVHEPRRLLLIWQGVEGTVRHRRPVAELVRAADEVVQFRYLADTEDFACAKDEGFVSFPAFRKLEQTYELGVVETFVRRLPPRSRGDYAQYLEQFRLHKDTPISDFALLGYTGAKLPSDGFSVVDPLENVHGLCDVLIEVAGFRHASEIPSNTIQAGMAVEFHPEPDNPHDPSAVAICIGMRKIGYVPRPQASAIRSALIEGKVEAHVERINGRVDRPLLYLFTRLSIAKTLQVPASRLAR